jgi:hypothetical protein
MSDLYVTLLTDGSSDAVLLRPLSWLLRQHLRPDVQVQSRWADLRGLRCRPRTLADRIKTALDFYRCDLMFIHRDAEREDAATRYAEIQRSVAEAQAGCYVAVVPVRMTEAWLLFDEKAIRRAAGNPKGRDPLPIPSENPESIPDPKQTLRQALQSACGLRGRRLHGFNVPLAVHLVGEYIDDFSPLRRLKAFQSLERDVDAFAALQHLKPAT